MMQSSFLFFCEECGAANPQDATVCAICQQSLDTSSPAAWVPMPINRPQQNQPTPFPSSPSADLLQPGALLAQRYHIIKQVGQGGFGVIYCAKDQQQKDKLVAIKEIDFQTLSVRDSIQATDTYNREVMLLSKLKHENLPRIYDHFTDPHHWYLVMDFIEGETLENMLTATPGGFSPKTVLNIGIQLCDVLSYLHRQTPPVIFRDVKPANVMYTTKGKMYLIDFGIARHFREGQTKDTGPLGSPGYAAPEQYGTAQTTQQTDVYGLGATLQTLLTGKDPLELAQDGTPSSSTDLRLPRLEQLISQMLEPEPTKRPKSMEAVKTKLESLKKMPATLMVLLVWVCLQLVAGLLIGSLPYSLMVVLRLLCNTLLAPFLYSSGFSYIPSMIFLLLLCSWPFLFVWQLILGLKSFYAPHRRFLGTGILLMVAFITLFVIFALILGWGQWILFFTIFGGI